MTTLKEYAFDRCIQDGDCMEFTGKPNPRGTMYLTFNGVRLNLRRAMYEEEHGSIPNGRMVSYGCENPKCIAHLKAITAKQRSRRAVKQGKCGQPQAIAKMAAARRASSKLNDESVSDIRSWEGKVADVAEKHGISATYAYMIRRNQCWRDYANPFAGLL